MRSLARFLYDNLRWVQLLFHTQDKQQNSGMFAPPKAISKKRPGCSSSDRESHSATPVFPCGKREVNRPVTAISCPSTARGVAHDWRRMVGDCGDNNSSSTCTGNGSGTVRHRGSCGSTHQGTGTATGWGCRGRGCSWTSCGSRSRCSRAAGSHWSGFRGFHIACQPLRQDQTEWSRARRDGSARPSPAQHTTAARKGAGPDRNRRSAIRRHATW